MQPHVHVQDKAAANPVAGLLSVKVPALGKKRGLPNWKVWRPFWVTAKRAKCPTKGVRGLQLSLAPLKLMHAEEPDDRTSKVFIPCGSNVRRTSSRSKNYVFAMFPSAVGAGTALVYLAGRSESESQRWMHDLVRFLDPNHITEPDPSQFEVTTLPSALATAASLSGVMGLLGVRPSGVALRSQSCEDENQGRLLGAWGWKQIDNARCRLAAAALPEDDGKICVIRTTSLFPHGAGELTVFCSKGRQLVKALQTKTASLLAALQIGGGQRVRRMSRSEGDLRFAFAQLAGDRRHADALTTVRRADASSVPNSNLCEQDPEPNEMLLTTRLRSHSDLNRGDACEQTTTPTSATTSLSGSPPDDGFSDDDLLDDDDDSCSLNLLDRRRVSNVSIASGVYETIDDDFERDVPVKVEVDEPPPLPPREYKLYGRRRPGGLHAFLKLQRLWRSNSENHVAHEEDEEIVDESEPEVIYSELHESPPTPEPPRPQQASLVRCRLLTVHDEHNLHHSSSCSNLPRLTPPPSAPLSRSANCVVQSDANGEEPTYLPMAACRPERKRMNSESAAFRSALFPGLAVGLSSPAAASSAENIYVTMTNDRKQSLASEIYALATGVEPSSSGP